MSKRKHTVDWYIDNMPSDEKEYDTAITVSMSILAAIMVVLIIGLLIIDSYI